MFQRARIPTALLVTALALTGCGSSAEKTDSSTKKSATPSVSSSPSASSSASASPAGKGVLTLADDKGVSGTPYWGLNKVDGWEIVVFDQQGLNQMKNATTGCQLTSYQAKLKDKPASDADGSKNLTGNYFLALKRKAASTKDLGTSTVVLGRGFTSDLENGVEFYLGAMDYVGTDKVARRSVVASRAFTKEGNALQLILTCKPTALPGGDATKKLMQELALINVE